MSDRGMTARTVLVGRVCLTIPRAHRGSHLVFRVASKATRPQIGRVGSLNTVVRDRCKSNGLFQQELQLPGESGQG